MADKIQICIIGSGSWGSAIAMIVGANATKFDEIDDRVTMFVFEEIVNGKRLTDLINSTHENVKYLPGHQLPSNVVAIPDIVDAASTADILVFVVPSLYIKNFCASLLGKIKPTAVAISLIKEFDKAEDGGIDLISHIITRHLKIPCSVLMGANMVDEVAEGKFCETTIGCRDIKYGKVLKNIFQAENFRVSVVDDVDATEVCGALKHIVSCGAGFMDGMNYGDNSKAAVIRVGLMEMIRFVDTFYPGSKLGTFFESCGVADLITNCFVGKNRRLSEAFVRTGKPFSELEQEMLGGVTLPGPFTAGEVNHMLRNKNVEDKFPLFTAIHKICIGELKPSELLESLRSHSDDIYHPSQLIPL
ncbi:GPD1 family protein [Megaselia abdita]